MFLLRNIDENILCSMFFPRKNCSYQHMLRLISDLSLQQRIRRGQLEGGSTHQEQDEGENIQISQGQAVHSTLQYSHR